MYFQIADITINPIWPFLAGLAVSIICTPTGLSGSLLLLPIAVNVFGFNTPSVTPTNLIFNILSLPTSLLRFYREKRFMWGLGLIMFLGSIPGILLGTAIRCTWLKNPGDFNIFMAIVLFCLSLGLMANILRPKSTAMRADSAFRQTPSNLRGSRAFHAQYTVKTINYSFGNENFKISTCPLLLISIIIGLIGGIYGIGGGAIIAPILLGLFQMPLYLASGASLLASWASSVFGLASYMIFWPLISGGEAVGPDIPLGLLFSLGGIVGGYVGISLQPYLPPLPLKIFMLLLLLYLASHNFGLI
ncbi:MAG: TSUP family transporter [Candidatus Adiutrix sp.]